MSTFDQYGAEYVRLISASDPPTTGKYGARLIRPIKDDGSDWLDSITAMFALWSTYPATSDVDLASHMITGAGGIDSSVFTSRGAVWAGDELTGSTGVSFFNLNATSSFGIHNGEPGGIGSDIRILSENGDVIVSPKVAFVVDIPLVDESAFVLRNKADVIANGGILFFSPSGSYDMGIAVAGVGQIWNCEAGTGIMSFNAPQHYFGSSIDDGSLAMVQVYGVNDGTPALSVQAGPVFVGATSDDGTGATVQITGSLSINGVLVTAP